VADLRLLSAAGFLLVALVASGCATTETPRIAGRVLDAKTREPVVGADVMVYRNALRHDSWHGATGVNFGHRWRKTDDNGRFDFPAVRDRKPYRIGGLRWTLEDEPIVRVMDERYGIEATDYRPERWDDPVRDFYISMELSEAEREAICEFEEERRVRYFCRGLYEPGGYHCIEVVKEMRCHEP